MSIKTEIKLPPTKPTHTLPAMYKSLSTNIIVLFTQNEVGTVLVQGTGYQQTGYHSHYWSPCTDAVVWERLPVGTEILLTQRD